MGIERGDWTVREVQAAKATVPLLWEDLDRVTSTHDWPVEEQALAIGNPDAGFLGLGGEEPDHYRGWQAKWRGITPG